MPKLRHIQALTAAVFGLGPSLALASDPGSPSEWLTVLYLIIAGPFTVASLIGIAAGGTFGWYKDRDAAIAHACVATLIYGCGIPLAFLAIESWANIFLALFALGVLMWISIKAPLKLHELQKPYLREKLFKDYY